jgi:hypothetical protein
MNCRNIFVVGRLTRLLPLSCPDGLPVYVARVPAASFCAVTDAEQRPGFPTLASGTDALQFASD